MQAEISNWPQPTQSSSQAWECKIESRAPAKRLRCEGSMVHDGDVAIEEQSDAFCSRFQICFLEVLMKLLSACCRTLDASSLADVCRRWKLQIWDESWSIIQGYQKHCRMLGMCCKGII